jgi:hypothetical protein
MSCDDYCNNYGCNRGPNCPARETKQEVTMTPLEQLHTRMGSPAWFWPCVGLVILVLWIGVSSLEAV